MLSCTRDTTNGAKPMGPNFSLPNANGALELDARLFEDTFTRGDVILHTETHRILYQRSLLASGSLSCPHSTGGTRGSGGITLLWEPLSGRL